MFPEAGSNKFQSILIGINQLIEADGLKPGDRLPSERELVSRLKAGRSTVREALRALELLGIITTRRGEGTYLQPYQSHRLVDVLAFYILRDEPSKRNLLEMRMLLETGAAGRAACRATDEDLESLTGILNRMEKKIVRGEVPVQEDFEFHQQVVRSAHNYLLLRIWHPVIQYGQAVWESSLSRSGRPEQALREHREIVDAIRRGDASASASLMERHLSNGGLPVCE